MMSAAQNCHGQQVQGASGPLHARTRVQHLLGQLQGYVDQVMKHVDHAAPVKQGKQQVLAKRKRSAYVFGDDQSFTEHLTRTATPTQDLLPLLNGELRHHQLVGVKWLASLYFNGRNGILSDELEVDRQVQAIGLLAYLQGKGVPGPFLIVAAKDTLPAWSSQLQQLLPGSTVHTYNAATGSRDIVEQLSTSQDYLRPNPPLILASHESLVAEAAHLGAHTFRYVVADASGLPPAQLPHFLDSLGALPGTNSSIVLLTGSHPTRQQPLRSLWPLLQLVVPQAIEHLLPAVADLNAAGASTAGSGQRSRSSSRAVAAAGGAAGGHTRRAPQLRGDPVTLEEVAAVLRSAINRFVLERTQGEVDLGAPRRTTEANLYDIFNAAT